MPFTWTAQRIKWYLDASSHSSFHRRLAERLAPFLRPEDSLCDLGCGLGRLDLLLAPRVSRITCVDTDKAVLARLAEDARQQGADHLSVQCCDARAVHGPFDVVLMSFFGYPPSLMLDCMSLARRRVIRIVHAGAGASHAGRPHKRRESAGDIARVLDAQGCRYQMLLESLEFGQPLASPAEGRAFMLANHPDMPPETAGAFLAEHLIETPHAEFPCYLQAKKELGIFIIER